MMKVGSVCLGLLGAFGLNATFQTWKPAIAQVVLDGTTGVGTVSGQVLTGPTYEIPQSLGTIAGNNLFHSFRQFDLATGEQANFRIDPSISRVLTRVTGGDSSTIDGILSTVDSDADFFLFNPAGLIFGPGAQLDLGGSFVGTTASAIGFGNQGEFSAAAPESPALLTVAPSALFFSASPGQITSRSVAPAQAASANSRPRFGLQVPTGESLLLVGGDVAVDGGGTASGGLIASGRLELGGLAAAGEILLTDGAGGAGLQLTYPDSVTLADVSLTNNALIIANSRGGDLVVNAKRLVGTAGSRLVVEIDGVDAGGDLVINARDIEFQGTFVGGAVSPSASGVFNQVDEAAIGKGGGIRMVGDRLLLSEGARVDSSTFTTAGNGDISLQLQDSIQIDSEGSAIQSEIVQGGNATEGGDIQIQTRQLTLSNGGQLSSLLRGGEGTSGDIRIEAKDIILDNIVINDDGFIPSAITSSILSGARGEAGSINIQTSRLNIKDGADISVLLDGTGLTGNLQIDAEESLAIVGAQQIDIDNQPILVSSNVKNSIGFEGVGLGGDIRINSPLLILQNGAFIDASSLGFGSAGDIKIDVGRLEISQREVGGISPFSGRISSNVFLEGDAGKISINAREIFLRDDAQISAGPTPGLEDNQVIVGSGGDIIMTVDSLIAEDSIVSSGIIGSEGDGGNITIQAQGKVQLSNSFLSTDIQDFSINGFTLPSNGTAGQIEIVADSLEMDNSGLFSSSLSQQGSAASILVQVENQTRISGASSFLGTGVFSVGSLGQGAPLEIDTGSLLITESASLLTQTRGEGNAGDLRIRARERIQLSQGTNLFTSTTGSGNAGDIKIESPRLEILDSVSVSSQAAVTSNSLDVVLGNAGDIAIQAKRALIRGSSLSTESTNGNGGSMVIDASQSLVLSGNATLSATAGTAETGGNGGNVDITTPFLIGLTDSNSDVIANAFSGKGGNITIQAQGIFNFEIASRQTQTQLSTNSTNDISASSQLGQSGAINLNGVDVDPSRGTAELPGEPSDRSNQITSSCNRTTLASSFQRTGRSGIPVNPSDFQTSGMSQAEWASLPASLSLATTKTQALASTRPLTTGIIPTAPTEITHWQRDRQGNVVLLGQSNMVVAKTNCAEKLSDSVGPSLNQQAAS